MKVKFKRRLYALLLTMSLVCFGLVAGAAPASAVGSYNNASIADIALTKIGQYGGQCKTFANNMVKQASGNTQWPAPGYHSGFANAGGIEVSSQNATKGDIIQIGNSDTDYPLHTAIIVTNKGGGNFNVVDSNWGLNEIVKQHDFNPYTWAPSGNIKIWRMGTVTGGQSGTSRPWGDFDGNGKADIAWYEPTSASGQTQLSVFGYTGSGFNRSWDNFGWGTPKWSGVGDFTGDGKADIAWYEPTSASGQTQLSIFASTGSGFSRISSSFGWGTPTWAGVGDFNGDGKADVAWYEPTSASGQPQLSIFAFNGSGFNRISSSFGWGTPKWASIGDLTSDGKADIAWYEPTSASGQPQLSVFAFNGSGFNRAWSSFGWGTPTWAGVGDFNGDGKADVAWYEPTSSSGQSQLSVFASTGSGFSRISSSFGWGTPKWSGVGDFTGDGKADIAWYEPTSASGQTQLSIFASVGTGFSRISSDFGWATPSWASSRSGSFANTNGSGSK